MDRNAWLEGNRAAIDARLEWLREQNDGTVFIAPAGVHFITVTKEGSQLRLWLLEQVCPSSGVIQSELNLNDPLRLVDPYSQAAMLALLWQPAPERVYFAGFGAGRVPMVMHHYLPQTVIDCAEIEPAVVSVAEKYFGVRLDARLRVHIEDGREWLAQHDDRYDIMVVDVFLDNGYSPYRLATVEFFELCQSRLQPGGVLVVNMLAEDKYLAERFRSLQAVFETVHICPTQEENHVAIAYDAAAATVEELIGRAKAAKLLHGFTFPFARHLTSLTTDLKSIAPNLEQVEPFHDAAPPQAYFDVLPSFTAPFSRPAPHLPCPCGSGQKYRACHGKPASL